MRKVLARDARSADSDKSAAFSFALSFPSVSPSVRLGCQRRVVEKARSLSTQRWSRGPCARTFRARAPGGAAMGACLSAPKPAADGPSVSARSARTFGVAPVQTAKSDVESSGEMVEIPLDTPPAAASGAGKGNGFGSFLQAKVTVDPGSAEDANGAAHRVRGALVPERDRIDQALVDDMDAAAASALAGSDEKDAESGSSADHVATAEAEAAAAREQDVSLVLSDDASDEETFSGSEKDREDDDDDSEEYDSSDASSAEVDEGEDAHPSAGSTEDAIEHATEHATDDVPAPATPQTNEPALNASDDAPIPVPGTPEQTRALTALEDDFEDSLSMVDMGPVSDSEASGSEFDSAASESYESDGDEDAENAAETAPSPEPSADVSASAPEAPRAPEAAADDSPDATVSDILDEDSVGDREKEPSADDSESSYASSAYSDEDDRFDADAGPLVASTVEAFGSTVDATVTEVRARSKHSPPPTPRVRGAADPEALGAFGSGSLGATPRSARRVACVTRGEIRERYREVLYAPATSKQHIATSCSEVLGTFTLLKTRSCEAGGGGNGMRDARGRSACVPRSKNHLAWAWAPPRSAPIGCGKYRAAIASHRQRQKNVVPCSAPRGPRWWARSRSPRTPPGSTR